MRKKSAKVAIVVMSKAVIGSGNHGMDLGGMAIVQFVGIVFYLGFSGLQSEIVPALLTGLVCSECREALRKCAEFRPVR